MRTYFASPERSSAEELEKQIKNIANHPLVGGLAKAINGIFAVCNEHRQILSVNDQLLNLLGIKQPEHFIGLRPGEALSCVHAHRCEGGCGTSEFCRSCGAAIAMVASLSQNEPVEKTFAITVNSIRSKEDFFFNVRSTPMQVEGQRFLLLTMQNITRLQNLQSLERLFLHGLSNLAAAISGLSEFAEECEESDMPLLLKALNSTSSRLVSEIKLQRMMISANFGDYQPEKNEVTLREIFEDSVDLVSGHPSITGKKLRKPEVLPEKRFATDKTLLLKVLQNMLINAFESTKPGRAVRFWVDCGKKELTFCVWNHMAIAESMHGRIFQRNYSTKGSQGHGMGTYSMKLFGEEILNGQLSYETSEERGTVFRFSLPISESFS